MFNIKSEEKKSFSKNSKKLTGYNERQISFIGSVTSNKRVRIPPTITEDAILPRESHKNKFI